MENLEDQLVRENESGFVVEDDTAGYNLNFDFGDDEEAEEKKKKTKKRGSALSIVSVFHSKHQS